MLKWTILVLSALLFLGSGRAFAIEYDFCVVRTSAGGSADRFGARYKFGDIDPGKEVARVIVSQKYKQADTSGVSVSDYNKSCGALREEANVNATGEQLTKLGQALGRGDPVGTAVAAGEIVAGVTVKTVEETGSALGRAAHWIGCRIGIGC